MDLRRLNQAEQALRARRYEFIRTLNPRQFGELWQRNLRGEGPFDDLVDAAMEQAAEGDKGER